MTAQVRYLSRLVGPQARQPALRPPRQRSSSGNRGLAELPATEGWPSGRLLSEGDVTGRPAGELGTLGTGGRGWSAPTPDQPQDDRSAATPPAPRTRPGPDPASLVPASPDLTGPGPASPGPVSTHLVSTGPARMSPAPAGSPPRHLEPADASASEPRELSGLSANRATRPHVTAGTDDQARDRAGDGAGQLGQHGAARPDRALPDTSQVSARSHPAPAPARAPDSWADPRWGSPVELLEPPATSSTPGPPQPLAHQAAASPALSIGTIEVIVVPPPAAPATQVAPRRPADGARPAPLLAGPGADRLRDGLRRWHGTAQG